MKATPAPIVALAQVIVSLTRALVRAKRMRRQVAAFTFYDGAEHGTAIALAGAKSCLGWLTPQQRRQFIAECRVFTAQDRHFARLAAERAAQPLAA